MTLIIVMLAAIITTVSYARKSALPTMKTGLLCGIYWISTVLISAKIVFKLIKYKEIPFSFSAGAIIHDSYTGLGIVAVGLIIWLGILIFIIRIKNK